VTGSELLRKIKRLGRSRGVSVKLIPRRGKGSHATLFYGERFTMLPDLKAELKKGTLHVILTQLGLTVDEF
jgi:mRNA interferase HicA